MPSRSGNILIDRMKDHFRSRIKQTLADMAPGDAERKSRQACAAVVSLPEFLNASTIMAYMTIPNETDASEIIRAAWDMSKTVLVPEVSTEPREMFAVELRSLEAGLKIGFFGILEPDGSTPWPADQIDMMIVPALAFDRLGNRLGRGGGFYDRFLAQDHMHAVTCGLAFQEQLLDEIPTEHHDRPVDLLVTDEEVLRF